VALQQAHGHVKKPALALRLGHRPPVGHQPMIWKEVFVERGLRLNWFGRIAVGVVVAASYLPVCYFAYDIVERLSRGYSDPFDGLSSRMNVWVRVVGAIAACLTLLAVAVRAASSLSGERDRQTWDGLLTTPLESDPILFAKWLGSILSVRWAWLWLGSIWGLGVMTGGLHFVAVPLLLLAWLIYAGTLASLGLGFSMACRTSLRATLGTLLTTLGAGGGHWFLWMICCLPLVIIRAGPPGSSLEFLVKTQAGLTPPFVFGGSLSFASDEFMNLYGRRSNDTFEMLAYGLLGLLCWTIAGVALWFLTSTSFRARTGRSPSPSAWPSALPTGQRLREAERINRTV
jgi:ABC-type transport system involved in multi-copper enzyme maturation permease subunit